MVTKRGKQILVLGASFQNKGAQAMLFSTISEFSKRFPESVFYFSTDCVYENEELYKFTPVNTHYENRYHVDIKQLISDIIHGKSNMTTKYPEIKGVMNDIDFVVDISGYALGSDWNYIRNKYYLDIIKFVKSYGKTIYLMPQSFGPFDYKEKETELKKSISKIMKYPKVIFAREMEGKESLENEFKLKNVRYSPDIVLQSDKINIESVFNKKIDLKIPEINSKKNVCIIPNRQIFKRGNEKKILGLYDNIINKLISMGYHVVCVSHSKEDEDICKRIIKNYDKKAILVNGELSCLEFTEFIRQFEFVIASRYHSIVHAYKENVPCIVMGWAVKYRELAKLMEQDDYIFSIAGSEIDYNAIIDSIDKIDKNLQNEKEKMSIKLQQIQKNSCFDIIYELEMKNKGM